MGGNAFDDFLLSIDFDQQVSPETAQSDIDAEDVDAKYETTITETIQTSKP